MGHIGTYCVVERDLSRLDADLRKQDKEQEDRARELNVARHEILHTNWMLADLFGASAIVDASTKDIGQAVLALLEGDSTPIEELFRKALEEKASSRAKEIAYYERLAPALLNVGDRP